MSEPTAFRGGPGNPGPLPMGPPGGDWRYAQLAHEPPCSPQDSASNIEAALNGRTVGAVYNGADAFRRRRADDDSPVDGPSEISRTRQNIAWFAPLILLLIALFVENTGLYLGTRCYVRWMDELVVLTPLPRAEDEIESNTSPLSLASESVAKAERGAPNQRIDSSTHPLQEALTLEDPLSSYIQGLRTTRRREGKEKQTRGAEFSVDLMTGVVALLWLGHVARTRDLRLWTKGIVAAVVLATLKGVVSWSTVLPDAAGWQGCQERLGPDGLMYYRELSAANSHGDSIQVSQALQDIILLEVRGLWMMGRSARQRVCADTVFSTPTSFCVLFAVSLYDAVRSLTKPLEKHRPETRRGWSARRGTVMALAATLLVLVVLADLALMVSSPHHYTLDVAVAVPLTLMVYGSPAIAIAAERWAQIFSVSHDEDSGECKWGKSYDSEAQVPVTTAERSQHDAGSFDCPTNLSAPAGTQPVRDMGVVTVPTCIAPFCSIGGLYYLRDEPTVVARRPWNEENQRQHDRLLVQVEQMRSNTAERREKIEGALGEERKRGKKRAGESAAKVDRQLEQREMQYPKEESTIIAEAEGKYECERRLLSIRAAESTAELNRISTEEANLKEQWLIKKTKLETDLRLLRQQRTNGF